MLWHVFRSIACKHSVSCRDFCYVWMVKLPALNNVCSCYPVNVYVEGVVAMATVGECLS